MILICFGTRPEFLKIKPLLSIMKEEEYQLLFTGQHPDLLREVEVDYLIHMTESHNRLDQLVSDCMLQFPEGPFTSVLVQGDTASAFGCALAAFHRKLPILYLEAGLRTYDLDHPYPEEGYRQMIARLSYMNFAPTIRSKENLEDECVYGLNWVTGNTSLDNLREWKDKCSYTDLVLVTMHRRENHPIMADWFKAINKIAQKYREYAFILPLHPNPNVMKHEGLLTHVLTPDPMTHEQLLRTLSRARLVITDSGGIQEEATYLNKNTIVCRKGTERPEGLVSGHLTICPKPNLLEPVVDSLIKNPQIDEPCPYGDGYAAEKVYRIIKQHL